MMATVSKKKFYELIAENIPNTVIKLFDKDLKILVVAGSKNFENAGINKEQLLGKTIHESYPKDYADIHSIFWKKALQGVSNEFEFDYAGKTWYYQFIPVRDDNDVLVGGMSMRQDISEKRDNLNHLESKHEHIVKIAWVTSHNLRAPSARIMGLVNILRQDHLTDSNKDIIQHLEASCSELEEMIRKIDDLANYDFYLQENDKK